MGTGKQRQEGQPAHTGQPTHTSGPTAKLRLSAYSRSDGYYSSARRVPFRAVCVFSFHFVFNFHCAACCLRLLDVVPVVSRSLHLLARRLRTALRRYCSGADRIRLCCCYTAVLCTRVRMVSVVPLCDTSATVQTRDLNTHSAVGRTRTFCSNEHVVTTPMCRLYLRADKRCECS